MKSLLASFLLPCCAAALPLPIPATAPSTQPAPIVFNIPDFGGDYLQRLNAVTALAQKASPRPVELVIPPGTHSLSSVWIVTLANGHVVNQGQLKMRNGAAQDATGDCVRLQQCTNVLYEGGVIDGNAANRAGPYTGTPHNIRILGGNGVEVRNVRSINSPGDGLMMWGGGPLTSTATLSQNVHVHDCYFDSPQRSCISVVGVVNGVIERNIFSNATANAPAAALDAEANPGDAAGAINGLIVRNNIATNCQGGMRVVGNGSPKGVQFLDNNLTACGGGIQVFGASGTAIQSNNLSGCTTSGGIGINSCDQCVVQFNMLPEETLYADTAGCLNPKGHVLTPNVAHAFKGLATATGNLQHVP